MPDSTPPATPRRSVRRIVAWLLGILIGLPVGLVVLALVVVPIGANTGPGRRLIEQQAASLTGGMIRIDGLGGRFPDALTARRIQVTDWKGPWLTIDGLQLDWSPLALLGMTAHVERAEAERIVVDRLPNADPHAKPSPPAKPGTKSGLHLAIRIDSLRIARFEVGQAVAGAPMVLSANGHARIADLAPILDGAAIDTLPNTDLALDIRRLDQPGGVTLSTLITPGRLALHAAVEDGETGFVATLGHLPVLAPLHLRLDLDGPRSADTLALTGTAGNTRTGVLDLGAHGVIDLIRPHFDVALALHAPAMQPLPSVRWNRLALDAHLVGTPAAPGGQGTLAIDELAASGAGVNTLNARFGGDETSGPITLHLVADGVRIPGPSPTLLAAAPLVLDARYDPHAASRPVELSLAHPLAAITGRVNTQPSPNGALHIVLPDLGPLAAAASTALAGHAALDLGFRLSGQKADATLSGPIVITGGQPQAVGLIGQTGRIALDAGKDGSDLVLRSLALNGDALHLKASGTDKSNVLDARFGLDLPALAKALPSLRGGLLISGTAQGPTDDLSAHLLADGTPGTATLPPGKLHLVVDAAHLPKAPQGTIALDGTLDRAPLTVRAEAARLADGTLHLVLNALDWKSATGRADMSLPAGAKLPLGSLHLHMARLADLRAVIGQPISGAVQADIQTEQPAGAAAPRVLVDVRADGGTATARVGKLVLQGDVRDPLGKLAVNLALDASGIDAAGVSGRAHATARGPEDALDIAARADMIAAGAPATLDTSLRLDLPQKRVAISRLAATGKGEALRLLAPASVAFGAEKSVDRLRLSVAPASGGAAPALVDLRGQIMPKLDLDAEISNVTPALAKPFAPTLDAAGTIGLQAHLTGTTAEPGGTVRLRATGLKLRTGPAASLPPASLNADVALAGKSARVDARLGAGPDVSLTVNGTAPLSATGPIALRADGRVDLRLANAVLGAQGREVEGVVQLALAAGGSARDPRLTGTIQLNNGQFQDFGQGVRLTAINALIRADDKVISIDRLVAHAGGGTIGASGTVGALQPGLPVDLHVVASKARPLSSDLLTATLDADLRIRGQAATRVDVGGTVTIDGASINVPNGLPPSVARLDVIRPGQKPPTASDAAALLIGLDLTLNAPGEIFVRGHGLDAELGGRLHVGGTSAAPVIAGGFDLRRGTFDLAGISLAFTKGRVGFNGAGVNHKIDPSLDFVAQSVVNGTVAQLNVGGYASAPKISLSSTPPLPQDQILALILFGQEMKSLSPLQIAQIATALASLTGSGGGFDPLGTLRKSLGLDRLSVGSGGNNGSGASVEAGKYVARGVYVGAKQATSGGGTQAQVQIDLTRRLKLLTTVGTGGVTTGVITPENDPGSSVALKYQFQY
ncbi:translocation/assembly module TamB domain-containing protein [Acetobacteraceae bacterium KSS8]|uniref:Translocation/assembly module TamB domain-containing protein n=1 Tax=Endosaccharibacter trunci TaxID=2812733 RepID=A0ABT1WBT8_9PROT|nr:translocation/assembly module TamB domain-containing protein [Acetobacteraceae bacterium KSS8]